MEKMSENEKKIGETIAATAEKMPRAQQDYLLAFAEGMAAATDAIKAAETAEKTA
jgi:hypothetical protein